MESNRQSAHPVGMRLLFHRNEVRWLIRGGVLAAAVEDRQASVNYAVWIQMHGRRQPSEDGSLARVVLVPLSALALSDRLSTGAVMQAPRDAALVGLLRIDRHKRAYVAALPGLYEKETQSFSDLVDAVEDVSGHIPSRFVVRVANVCPRCLRNLYNGLKINGGFHDVCRRKVRLAGSTHPVQLPLF